MLTVADQTNSDAQICPVFFFTPGERRIFRRKENLTVSQNAAKYRIVTNGPRPGRWSNDLTPYLVEPMDTLNLPWVRQIILQFAPQTGKSQVPINFLAYVILQDPGPCMYIMPDEKTTKRTATRSLIPMFRNSPRIAELMSPNSSDTTRMAVHFIHGMDLMMAWATSAAEMASESVRYLIRDEIDKFKDFTGKEADPRSLSDQRTNTFPDTCKIIDLSTPSDETGYVGRAMETEADEIRHYWAVCPICREPQILVFEQFSWPNSVRDPREIYRKRLARYQCNTCGMLWDDYQRNLAVRAGFWRSDNPVERPVSVGFHLPSWYSPFISLSKVVAEYLRGLEDPSKKYAFITQHAAEVYREAINPKKEDKILEHRTDLRPLIVPKEAVALTAGIDVQKFGFWFVVRAWADDLTSWLIHYGFLSNFDDVYTLIFETPYRIQDSEEVMEIWRAAMDTGGGESDSDDWTRTEEIYMWLRENGRGRVFGTKGTSHSQLQRVRTTLIDKLPRSSMVIPGGLELRMIDSDAFKGLVHWRLERGFEIDAKGNAIGEKEESQRFFLHADTGEDYAKQILAEELRRDKRGKKKWVKVRKDNHYLDCECLAAAAADGSWMPSLTMLAAYLKIQEPDGQLTSVKSAGQANAQRPRQQRIVATASWMGR